MFTALLFLIVNLGIGYVIYWAWKADNKQLQIEKARYSEQNPG